MKDTLTPPVTAMINNRRQFAGRLWRALVVYTACAFAGGLLGRGCYLPTPPAINDHLVFSDLRHVGAVVGAIAGSLVIVLLRRWLIKPRFSRAALPAILVTGGLLAWLLCDLSVLLGAATVVILALPWLIVWLQLLCTGAAKPKFEM